MTTKIKVRPDTEAMRHGCIEDNCCKPGSEPYNIWKNDFAGKIFEFYLPPTKAPWNFKCGSELVWQMVGSNGYCCEHQLELD